MTSGYSGRFDDIGTAVHVLEPVRRFRPCRTLVRRVVDAIPIVIGWDLSRRNCLIDEVALLLSGQVDYAKGTIQYHLRWLADRDLIEVSDDGQYTRYYPAADFDDTDQTVMNALRREYSRRILAHLIADGPLSTSDLSERLEKSQSTVSSHLSNLTETDLVTKERDGRSVVYEVIDPDRVRYLYTVYQQSFTDRVVDRLLGLWEGY